MAPGRRPRQAAPDPEAALEAVLQAALVHVPFEGWTMAALEAGAADAGYGGAEALRLFPGGAIDAIRAHSMLADRRMVAALDAMDLESMKVGERIAAGVRLRLEQNAAHREAIRRALARLALPVYAPLGLRLLYDTVDAIWYAAGDTATDFNFYTKRGLLAGVYGSVLLYWLDDDSEGFEATWAFLDRRIADALRLPSLLRPVRRLAEAALSPFELLRRAARRR